MKTPSIAEAKFTGKEKVFIRNLILDIAKGGKMLGLYGNGEEHRAAKRKGVDIYSIDNGSQNPDLAFKLKGPDKEFIDLKKYCLKEKNRKYKVIHSDYCGVYGKECRKNTRVLHKVMDFENYNEIYVFFTLMCCRERILKIGAAREDINAQVIKQIRHDLGRKKIKTDHFFSYSYPSKLNYPGRKKLGSTKMICHGFKCAKN